MAKKAKKQDEAPVVEETFPSWRYGPEGASMICETAEDVPEGWEDHPAAFATEEGEPEALDL